MRVRIFRYGCRHGFIHADEEVFRFIFGHQPHKLLPNLEHNGFNAQHLACAAAIRARTLQRMGYALARLFARHFNKAKLRYAKHM